MQENSKIHFIPAAPKREKKSSCLCQGKYKRFGAIKKPCCTRLVASTPGWLLVDVYMDVASGKAGTARKEFARMLEDCKAHKIEIILTKNISRFGRDTVEILEALNQLKLLGIRVIFEQEDLDTANTDSE